MYRLMLLLGVIVLADQLAAAPPKLISREDLLKSTDEAAASELRWITSANSRHNFAEWVMGPGPRDRTAFGRLVAANQVELFMQMAVCDHAPTADYGISGLSICAPGRLRELLPGLLWRCEGTLCFTGDIGFNGSLAYRAAQILERLSPDTDRDLLTKCWSEFLQRILSLGPVQYDELIFDAFCARFMPREWRDSPLADESQRLLAQILIDRGWPDSGDLDGAKEAVLGVDWKSPVRIAYLRALAVDAQHDELPKWVQAWVAAADGDWPSGKAPDTGLELGVESFAHWLSMPAFRAVDLELRVRCSRIIRESTPEAVTLLGTHPDPAMSWAARTATSSIYYLSRPEQPADDSAPALRVWLCYTANEEVDASAAFLGKLVTEGIDRLVVVLRGPDWSDSVGEEFSLPLSGSGISPLLKVMAESDRREIRTLFHRLVGHYWSQILEPSDDQASLATRLRELVQRDLSDQDLVVRWTARNFLLERAAPESSDRKKVFEKYAADLVCDLVDNPRLGLTCYAFADYLHSIRWDEGGPIQDGEHAGRERVFIPDPKAGLSKETVWARVLFSVIGMATPFGTQRENNPYLKTTEQCLVLEGTPLEYLTLYRKGLDLARQVKSD